MPRTLTTMTGPSGSSRSRRFWLLFLAVPFVATAFPALYAWNGPTIIGIPFFYWYQLLWTILTGLCTGIVWFATREPDR